MFLEVIGGKTKRLLSGPFGCRVGLTSSFYLKKNGNDLFAKLVLQSKKTDKIIL